MDGDITENIVVIGDVNVSVPDSYTLNYNVSDAAGNTATNTRIVTVTEIFGNPVYLDENGDAVGAAGPGFAVAMAIAL